MSKFSYFYTKQAEKFAYYRIPKTLFSDERFATLSTESKVLYGLMLDRMSNFQAYARQMATKGYIVDTNISEFKNLAAELQKITVNIRQIFKYADSLGALYAADATEIRQKLDES